MHLLKRILTWWHKPRDTVELFNKAECSTHCARDLGINVSRIRLPSGAEIVLVEDIREPQAEDRTDTSA